MIQLILLSDFAAIHTSSNVSRLDCDYTDERCLMLGIAVQSITHSLFNLAANTEYMQPLREEVEAVIQEHGWTKNAIDKVWKLDSFMRESQCLGGIAGSACTLNHCRHVRCLHFIHKFP